MQVLDFIFGRYLSDSESESQRIGVFSGIALLGLDALSSSAYGTEAAMTVMMGLGSVSLHYLIPISSIIIALLVVVFISYRQTIEAYPTGGGSYTVARENLGTFCGLAAAAALMLDYLLTVAVGIAAGVGALISAIPSLESHVLALCLMVLTLITIINLRGLKESGTIFLLPTYLFIVSLLGSLGYGIFKALLAHGNPIPVEALHTPSPPSIFPPVALWLLLRAFASGCAAMTGVEAVSNGVKSFEAPVVDNARRTLTAIILILIAMLGAVAYLSVAYKVSAADPNLPGYESVVSQIIRAVMGRGVIYYITIGSVVAVLGLSANTAFADFPRLCQIVSKDDYLPHVFTERGRRLVFSFGIVTLAVLAAVLLIVFGGVTDRLIPLYAIGAFLAFTLSQAGMVVHWVRNGGRSHLGKIFINGMGACATAVTLMVVLVSKFSEGGWISATVVALLMAYFYWVHHHYAQVAVEIKESAPLKLSQSREPIVILPFRDWNKPSRKALAHAMQLSQDVYAVHVFNSDYPDDNLDQDWKSFVEEPSQNLGIRSPQLVKLPNPYRKLFGALIGFIDETEAKYPDRKIAIVVPQIIVGHWYQFFLHNQRALMLNAVLLVRRDPKVMFVTVPWYLDS